MKKINILMLAALTVFSGATLSAQSYKDNPALSEKQKDFLEDNNVQVVCLFSTLEKHQKPETDIAADVEPIRLFLEQYSSKSFTSLKDVFFEEDDDDEEDISSVLLNYFFGNTIIPVADKSCSWYVSQLKGGAEDPYKTALARLYKLAAKYEKLGQEAPRSEL